MNWLLLILVALSPAVLYAVLVVAVAARARYFPRRCPSCGVRALRSINFIRATITIDAKLAPDSWEYVLCDACCAARKFHHGRWEDVSGEERQQHYPKEQFVR